MADLADELENKKLATDLCLRSDHVQIQLDFISLTMPVSIPARLSAVHPHLQVVSVGY
jgi:hypothetical protein